MPTRSQSARSVGNRDASLSAVGADGRRPGDGRETDAHGGSADSAGRLPEGCVDGLACGTRPSSSDVPDHTTSRCSRPHHKGRRGNGGSPGVERAWPLRAWTFPPKLGILNLLGEQSPGLLAGGGEGGRQPFLAVSRGCFPHSLSPRNLPTSRARTRAATMPLKRAGRRQNPAVSDRR